MKNNFFVAGRWCAFMLLVLGCALLVAGCGEDELQEATHTDTSFLKGTWANVEKGTHFVIFGDLSFTCEIEVEQLGKGNVKGRLDASNKNLGPNDYQLRNMTTDGNAATYPANATIKSQVEGFSDTLLATLTPTADKKKFTFSSPGTPAAQEFFGGEFTRQEE
jgi:hypothetical protein